MLKARASLTILLAVACATPGVPRPSGISESDAISIAEEFVDRVGYARSGRAQSAKPGSDDAGATEVRTPLSPKACGVIATNLKYETPGWTITFCYDAWYAKQRAWQSDLRFRRRVVVMDPQGANAELVHEDFVGRWPGLKELRLFDDGGSRIEITEQEAVSAAFQFGLRNGFIVGAPTNPGRDWALPSSPTGRVRATPRLPLSRDACAIVSRDIRRSQAGWSVGFCYDSYFIRDQRIPLEGLTERLRFITMDPFGDGIDMMDEDGDWTVAGLKRLREPPK